MNDLSTREKASGVAALISLAAFIVVIFAGACLWEKLA